MGKKDLKTIFLLTALVTSLVTLAASFFSLDWSTKYFLVAALALVNWIALAAIFHGLAEKKPLTMIAGIMAKPFLLLLFALLGVMGFVEVSSFLAGMNTFIVVTLVYLTARFLAGPKHAEHPAPMSEIYG